MNIPQETQQAAAQWQVLLSDRPTAQDRQRFESWRMEHPSHAHAFACIESARAAFRAAAFKDPELVALRQRALAVRVVPALSAPWLRAVAAVMVIAIGSVVAWRLSHSVTPPTDSLVFDNTRLEQAIAEINERSGATQVVLGDSGLARLPVTGIFSIRDGMDKRFVEAVAAYYPIAVIARGNDPVVLVLRSSKQGALL